MAERSTARSCGSLRGKSSPGAKQPLDMLGAATVFDVINSVAQVGTLIVVAATAAAGLIQLRHLRASNELEALLRLTEHLREPELQTAFTYVQGELEKRLDDPVYRSQLSRIGFVDSREHPEMDVCNWFNEVGALVKNRLIDESIFLDLFARLVMYYWTKLAPAIALLRRERGSASYENFEYLACLAKTWLAKHPAGTFPSKISRMPLDDRFAAVDTAVP